ncbi:MAG: SGNH/GDSL hydrolase family protein [Solirubrobacterales bacterium]
MPETTTPAAAAKAEAEPVTVAALGDSITAGNPLYDPDPAARVRLGFGEEERSQYEYWATESEPGYLFTNCGVFGERTDEIAARLDQCSEGAHVLLVQGGINDIAQGVPVETASENLRAMVQAGKQAGQTVVLVDILPWNNGHPGADAPIAELNEEIARIAAEEKVELLRFHDALEDPDEPGVMASGLTDDGDHPSIEGYRRLGELFPPPEELIGSG